MSSDKKPITPYDINSPFFDFGKGVNLPFANKPTGFGRPDSLVVSPKDNETYKDKVDLGFSSLGGERALQEGRALRQTTGELIGKAIGNIGVGLVSEIAAIPGYAAGVLSGFDFDNFWLKGIDYYKDVAKDTALEVYVPPSVQESGLWNQLGERYFWAGEGADAVGSLLSFMVPGAILKAANVGKFGAEALAKFGRLADTVADGSKLLQAEKANDFGKFIFKTLGKSGRALDFGKLAGNIDSGVSVVFNTAFEAAAEAKDMYDQAVAQGDDIETASSKARNIFLLNSMLLAASNTFLEKYVFQGFNRVPEVKNLVTKALKNEKISLNKVQNILGGTAKGLLSEGLLEEGLQTSFQQGVDTSFSTSLANGLNKYFSNVTSMVTSDPDIEFGKSVILGGLLGSTMGAYGGYREVKETEQLLYGSPKFRPNMIQRALNYTEKEKTNGVIDTLKGGFEELKIGKEALKNLNNPDELIKATVNNAIANYYYDLLEHHSGNQELAINEFDNYLSSIEIDTNVRKILKSAVEIPLKNNTEILEFIRHRRDVDYFSRFASQPSGFDILNAHIEDMAAAMADRYESSTGLKFNDAKKQELVKDLKDRVEKYENNFSTVNNYNSNLRFQLNEPDKELKDEFDVFMARSKSDAVYALADHKFFNDRAGNIVVPAEPIKEDFGEDVEKYEKEKAAYDKAVKLKETLTNAAKENYTKYIELSTKSGLQAKWEGYKQAKKDAELEASREYSIDDVIYKPDTPSVNTVLHDTLTKKGYSSAIKPSKAGPNVEVAFENEDDFIFFKHKKGTEETIYTVKPIQDVDGEVKIVVGAPGKGYAQPLVYKSWNDFLKQFKRITLLTKAEGLEEIRKIKEEQEKQLKIKKVKALIKVLNSHKNLFADQVRKLNAELDRFISEVEEIQRQIDNKKEERTSGKITLSEYSVFKRSVDKVKTKANINAIKTARLLKQAILQQELLEKALGKLPNVKSKTFNEEALELDLSTGIQGLISGEYKAEADKIYQETLKEIEIEYQQELESVKNLYFHATYSLKGNQYSDENIIQRKPISLEGIEYTEDLPVNVISEEKSNGSKIPFIVFQDKLLRYKEGIPEDKVNVIVKYFDSYEEAESDMAHYREYIKDIVSSIEKNKQDRIKAAEDARNTTTDVKLYNLENTYNDLLNEVGDAVNNPETKEYLSKLLDKNFNKLLELTIKVRANLNLVKDKLDELKTKTETLENLLETLNAYGSYVGIGSAGTLSDLPQELIEKYGGDVFKELINKNVDYNKLIEYIKTTNTLAPTQQVLQFIKDIAGYISIGDVNNQLNELKKAYDKYAKGYQKDFENYTLDKEIKEIVTLYKMFSEDVENITDEYKETLATLVAENLGYDQQRGWGEVEEGEPLNINNIKQEINGAKVVSMFNTSGLNVLYELDPSVESGDKLKDQYDVHVINGKTYYVPKLSENPQQRAFFKWLDSKESREDTFYTLAYSPKWDGNDFKDITDDEDILNKLNEAIKKAPKESRENAIYTIIITPDYKVATFEDQPLINSMMLPSTKFPESGSVRMAETALYRMFLKEHGIVASKFKVTKQKIKKDSYLSKQRELVLNITNGNIDLDNYIGNATYRDLFVDIFPYAVSWGRKTYTEATQSLAKSSREEIESNLPLNQRTTFLKASSISNGHMLVALDEEGSPFSQSVVDAFNIKFDDQGKPTNATIHIADHTGLIEIGNHRYYGYKPGRTYVRVAGMDKFIPVEQETISDEEVKLILFLISQFDNEIGNLDKMLPYANKDDKYYIISGSDGKTKKIPINRLPILPGLSKEGGSKKYTRFSLMNMLISWGYNKKSEGDTNSPYDIFLLNGKIYFGNKGDYVEMEEVVAAVKSNNYNFISDLYSFLSNKRFNISNRLVRTPGSLFHKPILVEEKGVKKIDFLTEGSYAKYILERSKVYTLPDEISDNYPMFGQRALVFEDLTGDNPISSTVTGVEEISVKPGGSEAGSFLGNYKRLVDGLFDVINDNKLADNEKVEKIKNQTSKSNYKYKNKLVSDLFKDLDNYSDVKNKVTEIRNHVDSLIKKSKTKSEEEYKHIITKLIDNVRLTNTHEDATTALVAVMLLPAIKRNDLVGDIRGIINLINDHDKANKGAKFTELKNTIINGLLEIIEEAEESEELEKEEEKQSTGFKPQNKPIKFKVDESSSESKPASKPVYTPETRKKLEEWGFDFSEEGGKTDVNEELDEDTDDVTENPVTGETGTFLDGLLASLDPGEETSPDDDIPFKKRTANNILNTALERGIIKKVNCK